MPIRCSRLLKALYRLKNGWRHQRALYFGMALCKGLWIYILIGFIALVTVIKIAMGKMTGNIRNQFLDRIMPFSTYKQLTASIFLNNWR